MAPWDELPYFDLPRFSAVLLPMTTATLLVGANPQRVAILVSNASSSAAFVVGPDGTVGAAKGLVVAGSFPVFALTQREYGILAQGELWAWAAAAATITVVEVLMHAWPGEDRNGQAVAAASRTQSRQRKRRRQ